MKRVVLDTNVLLADPGVLLSYPDAEIVIPETVLGELDKLKTSRADADLRFRGREVSRMLFELSEQGSLIRGVEMPDGGRLRVVPLDSESALPDGLATRNADDRILATAWQVHDADGRKNQATLVTNDLNMLLKAQTLGLPVERHGEGVEGSFARRYIVRPFQRYRVPLAILALALAVFVAIIFVSTMNRGGQGGSVPAEFKELLTPAQTVALEALQTLQENPADSKALLTMGNFYFDLHDGARTTGDPGAALTYARQAIRYYDRYLEIVDTDNSARADLAASLFYAGQTDRAIQEVGEVLQRDPNHVEGNFNLGIFYWQGRRDFQQAAAQFEKVIRLTEGDSQKRAVSQQATVYLEQVRNDAEAAGTPLGTTEPTETM